MASIPSKAILTLIGMPLDEESPIGTEAREAIKTASVFIGESRKVTLRYLKFLGLNANSESLFFMDPPRQEEWERMKLALRKLKDQGGHAVLFSDTGMPVLFDPGIEILNYCREHGFTIRCAPSPTSWGTACAVCGFAPPFFLFGFLPRESEERIACLRRLKTIQAHHVIMETPYRFRLLLKQLIEVFGPKREAFLAWDIAKTTQQYLWGTLSELAREADNLNLQKGEFVFIVKHQ